MKTCFFSTIVLISVAAFSIQSAAGATPISGKKAGTTPAMQIRIGQSSRLLTGPWRFHPGDDPRWAVPDSTIRVGRPWTLPPAPGAHDGDVGLTDYVPRWWARGHKSMLHLYFIA